MNHYGRLVHDHWRSHRPAAYSRIPDPDSHFTSLGEAIQAAVTSLRDEILGPPAADLEDYRNRSYQARRHAEELVLHDLLSEVNLEALEVLDRLRDGTPASPQDQAVLARWSGWGSLPQLFDEDDAAYAEHRAHARRLLGDDTAWAEARRTVLNAHYSSADVVRAMWKAVQRLGFTGGRVLEPGCGSGNFIGFAPGGTELVASSRPHHRPRRPPPLRSNGAHPRHAVRGLRRS